MQNEKIDTLAQLCMIEPDSPLAALRAQRPDVVENAQRSYETIFEPADEGGLTQLERAQAALRVALLEENHTLITHYRQLVLQHGTAQALEAVYHTQIAENRTAAILSHVDLLTLRPAVATAADLHHLQTIGLSTRNIVSLSQLIAFLSFQVRIVAVLQLLNRQSGEAAAANPERNRVSMALAQRAEFVPKQGFTLDAIGWDAWLPTLKLEDATAEQITVLEESTPTAKTSPYYLLLVQDVDVLRARSRLYNAIMYGARGAKRADRELAALAVSRINGCPYCASIHAQRYVQLTKDTDLATRLWHEGIATALDERQRTIVNFAVKLTTLPNQLHSDDLTPLRQHALSDWEILDIAHASAMFAWANRLMQTLGEPVGKQ